MSFFDDIQIIHPVKYCYAINLRFISQGKLCGWELKANGTSKTCLARPHIYLELQIKRSSKICLPAKPFEAVWV
jgi:hypothetical protein